MAFCSNCGGRMADDARFCPSCGQTHTPEAAASGSGSRLQYTVQGSNLQVARVHLQPGQELYAEAGRMIYKTANVNWNTRMTGNSVGDKIWGAIKRKLSGVSLFLTHFESNGPGEVGFAGAYPGRIEVFNLQPGQTILVQKESFLFAEKSVKLDIALVKRLGAGFFGGEGFILQKLTGPGTVFIHGGGDMVDFPLGPGQTVQVEPGCIVAFEESVHYDIQFVGSIKTALFGGEGIFLATMTGPGRCLIQSMTLSRMRRELAPHGARGSSSKEGVGRAGRFRRHLRRW